MWPGPSIRRIGCFRRYKIRPQWHCVLNHDLERLATGMTQILIIEDEPAIAENLRFALAREGFAIAITNLAANGVALLREQTFDLVILDVGLPDGSGFDACKRIRAFSDVPVIFLTARGDEIDRVVGLEIGADDYVVKPFSLRELVARVHVILRRRTPPGSTASFAPATTELLINEERARIQYRGRTLELTRYEYLLLKLLAEHPGRVYSRAHIMDIIWPATSGTGDRTVDAHVKTLRAKLKAVAPDQDPIQTHRGLGYSVTG